MIKRLLKFKDVTDTSGVTCDQASLIFFVAAGRYLSAVIKNGRDA